MSEKRESDESESLFLRTDYTFTSLSEMSEQRSLQQSLSSDSKLPQFYHTQNLCFSHIFHADCGGKSVECFGMHLKTKIGVLWF